MKKSTDMFAAQKSRAPDTQAIALPNEDTLQGTAYSPFVVSLQEKYQNPLPVQIISTPKEKKHTPTPKEKKGYEHLFASCAQKEQKNNIPERAVQIKKAKESIERMQQQLSTPAANRNGGFFRNIKNIGINK